jgi:hypothetical protein
VICEGGPNMKTCIIAPLQLARLRALLVAKEKGLEEIDRRRPMPGEHLALQALGYCQC